MVACYVNNRLCNKGVEELMDYGGERIEDSPEYKFGRYIFEELRLFKSDCMKKEIKGTFEDSLPDASIFGVKVKITLVYEDK